MKDEYISALLYQREGAYWAFYIYCRFQFRKNYSSTVYEEATRVWLSSQKMFSYAVRMPSPPALIVKGNLHITTHNKKVGFHLISDAP